MYASSMKYCGAMELCGIGWPRGESLDQPWPEIEAQMAAQKAGLLVAIVRESKPEELDLMRDKGFAPVYRFTNPRTGNVGVLYIRDFTGAGGPVTKLPESIPWAGNPPVLADSGVPAPLPSTAWYYAVPPRPPRLAPLHTPTAIGATADARHQARIDEVLDLLARPRIMVNATSVPSPGATDYDAYGNIIEPGDDCPF